MSIRGFYRCRWESPLLSGDCSAQKKQVTGILAELRRVKTKPFACFCMVNRRVYVMQRGMEVPARSSNNPRFHHCASQIRTIRLCVLHRSFREWPPLQRLESGKIQLPKSPYDLNVAYRIPSASPVPVHALHPQERQHGL